jgi:hypothetical protein
MSDTHFEITLTGPVHDQELMLDGKGGRFLPSRLWAAWRMDEKGIFVLSGACVIGPAWRMDDTIGTRERHRHYTNQPQTAGPNDLLWSDAEEWLKYRVWACRPVDARW